MSYRALKTLWPVRALHVWVPARENSTWMEEFWRSSENMAPISMRLCFVSRYTVPRKLSGIDSCAAGNHQSSQTQRAVRFAE